MSAHSTILFDGVCNLCERTVRFIIRRDKTAHFQFAVLQSEIAQILTSSFAYEHDELSSLLLIADGKVFRKAQAALQIARRLDGAWPLFYYLFFWVPDFIADPVYDFIAKRRYQWFGRKEACWIPSDELRMRFLDDPETDSTP